MSLVGRATQPEGCKPSLLLARCVQTLNARHPVRRIVDPIGAKGRSSTGMPLRVSEEARYLLLSYIADHPQASQRDVADALGVSLGKVNYCVRALIGRGMVNARRFRNSRKKAAYTYYLTPEGIQERVAVTKAFLKQKIAEYDLLVKEIERLSTEVSELDLRTG